MTALERTTDPNEAFYGKSQRALRNLFERAKAAHELHFAMALMPEFRGCQDAGWNTANEAVRAYDELTTLIKSLPLEPVRLRVALAFYATVSEGSGFYEIPKALMLTTEGKGNNIWPFQSLVKRHRFTGDVMAPNANRIMKDLIGHASELGMVELAETFRDAFDPDVRNAIAHADYIIWDDGLRLRRRNGGYPRVIPFEELDALLGRGINLFSFIRGITEEYVQSYDTPKTIRSYMMKNEPLAEYTIYFDRKTHAFGFTTGKHPPS